ncbi:bifunctional phosphoglucose/phosphomannose isomerase [Pontibacter chinhatensis]|uniref:Bifunctional phosphoglucose/phosphomannose isomerase n=1 Tax=Pontibacter chinhatensis TaxID=1436961 RepID=A0A1I2U6M1_9BACT|nr:bifunctional phosphoglucose/phosphomannose isomerase [Pontibacter chinhatensis]SFG72728.1 bifunctional phosphoglucose/phosphomannose isomerase [Pontibacter chinhatensis]
MKELIENFAQQLRQAMQAGESENVNLAGPRYSNVVMAGMGGSGICGNLAKTYVANKLTVPVLVQKCHSLPAFVGSKSLVIATSFSGNTEETLSMVRQAMEAEATVSFVSSGGEMLRIAQANNVPHLTLPTDAGPPRACLGFMLVQQLYLLHYAGLLDNAFKTELRQSIDLLEEQAGSIKVQASALASSLHTRLPILYADETFMPVAMRFQQQLNTNAKQLAHVNALPELCHNEVETWQNPSELNERLAVLYIKTGYDHLRSRLRMGLVREALEQKGQQVLEVEAIGATMLEQMFYLIHLFDWVSLYLAGLNKVNPGDTETINHLKRELSKV